MLLLPLGTLEALLGIAPSPPVALVALAILRGELLGDSENAFLLHTHDTFLLTVRFLLVDH